MKRILIALVIMGGMLSAIQIDILSASSSVPTYRVYNPNSGEHLFTPNKLESDQLSRIGWKAEGVSWYTNGNTSNINVYRLYNPNSGDHFYTADTNELKHLLRVGWKDDKYIIPAKSGGLPIYRLYNPNAKTGTHHYTLDSNERDMLKRAGWRYEGIAFYASSAPSTSQNPTGKVVCKEDQIKGSENYIYHLPTGRDYNKTTNPIACFDSEDQAVNAGFRKSKV